MNNDFDFDFKKEFFKLAMKIPTSSEIFKSLSSIFDNTIKLDPTDYNLNYKIYSLKVKKKTNE